MISKNILALTLGISLLSVILAPSMASASLVGDEVTINLAGDFSQSGFGTQTKTVGAGPEFQFPRTAQCGSPDESIEVDLDGSTIWVNIGEATGSFLYCDDTGAAVDSPLIFTLTSLDWVGQSGIITGITNNPPVGGVTAQVLGPHSVEIRINANGAPQSFTVHFDLNVVHSIAGEILPIDSTALFLAGMQSSALWLIPSVVGIAGVGFYVVRAKMNKDA